MTLDGIELQPKATVRYLEVEIDRNLTGRNT